MTVARTGLFWKPRYMKKVEVRCLSDMCYYQYRQENSKCKSYVKIKTLMSTLGIGIRDFQRPSLFFFCFIVAQLMHWKKGIVSESIS